MMRGQFNICTMLKLVLTLKRAAFAAADVAIAASGTVSLELAANHVPMVIAYKMHPLTHWLTQRALLIDTVTLVNLVSETRVVPEFIGPALHARPDRPRRAGPAARQPLPGRRHDPDHGASGPGRRGSGPARRAVSPGASVRDGQIAHPTRSPATARIMLSAVNENRQTLENTVNPTRQTERHHPRPARSSRRQRPASPRAHRRRKPALRDPVLGVQQFTSASVADRGRTIAARGRAGRADLDLQMPFRAAVERRHRPAS